MKRFQRRTIALLVLVVAAVSIGYGRSGLSADGPASEPTAAPAPTFMVTALEFISGRWQTNFSGDHLEEYWSPPAGDSIMGVFRWVKGGKVWMNELMTIVDEGQDVVLRLKHFDAKMVGWEEKAECLTLSLVRGNATEAEFEGTNKDQPMKFIYRKVGENLQVRIESSRDGKPKTDEFTFRRAP